MNEFMNTKLYCKKQPSNFYENFHFELNEKIDQ